MTMQELENVIQEHIELLEQKTTVHNCMMYLTINKCEHRLQIGHRQLIMTASQKEDFQLLLLKWESDLVERANKIRQKIYDARRKDKATCDQG